MVDIITAAMGAKMASASVQSMVDTALTSVYKYKGQCTNAQLSSKTKTAGDVWEISDDGTFAAGTDVVCNGTQWNAMSGHLHVNVVDALDSTSSQDALSANMGHALDVGKQDKLTAGDGISIVDNVISAGGGDWTYHSGSDWTDLFTINGGTMTAKYDITIWYNNSPYNAFLYIPKGTSGGQFRIPATGSTLLNGVLRIAGYISFFAQDLASSTANLPMALNTYTFTTDGTNVTITSGYASQNRSKANFLTVKYK